MEKKYDSFIDLAPGYESVVDLSADQDASFWSRYIVTEDMAAAVKTIAKALKPDDPQNDVKHFWLKGSYGTGKTYSAIVLKHLLQDDYDIVETFLNKNKKFVDVKDKFLGARKKGKYYVKFRSGECLQLNTSNKFLFQIEQSIRELLKENGFEYTGRNSLIESVMKTTKTFKSVLAEQFEEGAFPEFWSTYDTFEDFCIKVETGDVEACSQAQEILETLNIGLATDLDTFKAWVSDVFAGNHELSKTGIFIIWDEFTEYIRHNDLDIIQQLSLFSKEQPLYIIYVMHEYPGLFSEDITANMSKADARFHKIDIAISDDTTRRLISESIIVKDGMKSNWADICDDLYATISSNAHEFMSDPGADLDSNTLKKIFPIHPMTVELVTRVAGIAASGRSIFMFLKSNDDDGFRTYIRENGFYDWKWVTADYLWDYYFVNNAGGKKTLTNLAEDCLKHYQKVADSINDEKALRVFKAAMLLLATIGSGQSMKKSRQRKGIQATQKTLYDCFSGAISQQAVDEYLRTLSSDPINAIVLAPDLHDGYRLELPYAGTGGELDAEIASLKASHSIGKLFEANEAFGSVIKTQFASDEKAVVKRLILDTCWGTTQQIQHKYGKLKEQIEKTNHKFGILVVAASSQDELKKAATTASNLLAGENTERMMVCIMKHCLSTESIDQWYELVANARLASKANKTVNANSFSTQADEIVATWVSTALGKEMDVIYDGKTSHSYTNKGVLSLYEKNVFKVFPSAPESIIKKQTLYKSVSVQPAYYALTRTTLQNKSAANDRQKNFNHQWQDVVDILRENDENVWDCTNIEDIINMSETRIGRSMSALCSYMNKQLTSGTVFLPDLWEGLQKELGYYDTSVCCYLLGFVFKFFEGRYTWHDGNNAHKMDDDSIPKMITEMCSGKAQGMKISSESDIEKRFKSLTKRVFLLDDNEAGDVYECRKNVKVHITKMGFPIWAVKYIDDEHFYGIKAPLCSIIDKYIEYILEIGSQADVMEAIVELFKPNVKLYARTLTDILKDKAVLASGLRNFILENSPEAKPTCDKYGFTADTLIGMLGRSLEEEIWQWREEKIEATTKKVVLDLRLVGVVNEAIDGTAESVEKTRETLADFLGYIKVPGCVYNMLDAAWAPVIQMLYDISLNKWIGYSSDEKNEILIKLEANCAEAIENVNNPISVVKQYVRLKGLGDFSDAEFTAIEDSLPKEAFTQTESNFKANIRKKIEELGYTKKVRTLQSVWNTSTGFSTLSEWTKEFQTPVNWVLPDLEKTFTTLKSVEMKERVDVSKIESAITELQETDLSPIMDRHFVDRKFIVNVASDKYADLLMAQVSNLRLKVAEKYKNPDSWSTNIVAIREVVEDILLNEIRNEAISRLSNMGEKELRDKMEALLKNSAEACMAFMD